MTINRPEDTSQTLWNSSILESTELIHLLLKITDTIQLGYKIVFREIKDRL
jgi:hypothetical protein